MSFYIIQQNDNLRHFGNMRILYELNDICVAVCGVIYSKEMSTHILLIATHKMKIIELLYYSPYELKIFSGKKNCFLLPDTFNLQ